MVLAVAAWLLTNVDETVRCYDFCSDPCHLLNGNIEQECGACTGSQWQCRPGEPGFARIELVAPVSVPAPTPPVPYTDGLVDRCLGKLRGLSRDVIAQLIDSTVPKYDREAACENEEDPLLLPSRGFLVLRSVLPSEAHRRWVEFARVMHAEGPSPPEYFYNNTIVFGGKFTWHDMPEILREDMRRVQARLHRLAGESEALVDLQPVKHESQHVALPASGTFCSVVPRHDSGLMQGLWHIDSYADPYKLWVNVDKESQREQPDLGVVPRTLFNQFCAALDGDGDKPLDGDIRRRDNVVIDASGGVSHQKKSAFISAERCTLVPDADERMDPNEEWQCWISSRLFERLGCTLRLPPGDGVLFSTDVFHRTHDLHSARTAAVLAVETHKAKREIQPGYKWMFASPLRPRPPPSAESATGATVAQPPQVGPCGGAVDVDSAALSDGIGFHIARQALSAKALEASVLDAKLLNQTKGGYFRGRVHASLARRRYPSLYAEAERLLPALQQRGLLREGDVAIEEIEIIKIDPELAARTCQPPCSLVTEDTSMKWHTDPPFDRHSGSTGTLQGKLWVMLDKSIDPEHRLHSNLIVRPQGDGTSGGALGGASDGEECVAVLDPGDAIYFDLSVMHRTQDMKTRRVAGLMDVVLKEGTAASYTGEGGGVAGE